MRHWLLIVLSIPMLTYSVLAESRIVENNKMSQVMSHVEAETLLVFDLDSTIMKTAQMLGSDAWFSQYFRKNMDCGMDEAEAINKAIDLWKQIHRVTAVQPVESDIPGLIADMQDNKVVVMALTARPGDVSDNTLRQLESIDVDFFRNAPYKKRLKFESMEKPVMYYKGILFVGELNDKGEALNKFLNKIKYKPQKVIFVDDSMRNVKAVDAALKMRGVDCYCVRYGGADDDIKRFNKAIADVQLNYFDKILSDSAAKAIIRSRKSLPD